MLKEYDFTNAVQGKYSEKYAEGTNIVVIEPDVAEYFPDHDSVNEALRSLIEIIKNSKVAFEERKTVPYAAVLQDIPGDHNSLTTGERITLDP